MIINSYKKFFVSLATLHQEELLKEYLVATNQVNKFLHPETRYGKGQFRFGVADGKIVD